MTNEQTKQTKENKYEKRKRTDESEVSKVTEQMNRKSDQYLVPACACRGRGGAAPEVLLSPSSPPWPPGGESQEPGPAHKMIVRQYPKNVNCYPQRLFSGSRYMPRSRQPSAAPASPRQPRPGQLTPATPTDTIRTRSTEIFGWRLLSDSTHV